MLVEFCVMFNFIFFIGVSYFEEYMCCVFEVGLSVIVIVDDNFVVGIVCVYIEVKDIVWWVKEWQCFDDEYGLIGFFKFVDFFDLQFFFINDVLCLIFVVWLLFEDVGFVVVLLFNCIGWGSFCCIFLFGWFWVEKGSCIFRFEDFMSYYDGFYLIL